MSDILEVIKTRRSVKKFKSDLPKQEDIDKIIEAGLFAASGKNMQDTIILAVTNKNVLAKLSKSNASIMNAKLDPFYGAPVVLIVLGKRDNPNSVYDGSLVMGNLMLEAHSLGIGSCWINRAKEEFEMDEWKAWLLSVGIEGDYIGIAHCALGYPDGEERPFKERKENRVFYIK